MRPFDPPQKRSRVMPLTPNNTESHIDPLLRSRSVFDDDLSEHASNDGHDQLSEREITPTQDEPALSRSSLRLYVRNTASASSKKRKHASAKQRAAELKQPAQWLKVKGKRPLEMYTQDGLTK
ncbi:hypothetical protein VC83_00152 [Pseudogymnoascus destructans]|uniref:Uncharacterized protein n=2 Tax=Pseudogymnoascus destructans TaxID=655981 RepID=L8FUQ5_PSED2|nr:uncharacterized protein VC83_00152 [Pseudogymnoascus destructans]ELR03481.1 hypothetical protein GMDG_06211 [Pseudogymnoascus destructans 20631-21]OAF63360.1 hypothetical protein VC83_00152 [Pseudogymnoascus destructans]